MTCLGQAITQRGEGRVWQGQRSNGANTLTIAAGHAIDALCFLLGEFTEVTTRLATIIPEWHNVDTGQMVRVDSPDWISVAGRLEGGAEASFLTGTVPNSPSGNRLEIYGSAGTLVITGGSPNLGPNHLQGARGAEPLSEMRPPERFTLAPSGTPDGPPRNVAQAYVRLAQALQNGASYQPDFAHALKRHRLIEAIERSDAERKAVTL
jgi:predicted dehydrogenase